MRAIAVNLKQINTIDISNCPLITNAGVFTIAKHCPKLKEIVIEKQQFNSAILQNLENKNIKIIYAVMDQNGLRNHDIKRKKSPSSRNMNSEQSSTCDGVMFGSEM